MKHLLFILVAIMFISCENNNEEKHDTYKDFLESHSVFQIKSIGEVLYCYSSKFCSDCKVPPEMSSIPLNYFLTMIKDDNFHYKQIEQGTGVFGIKNSKVIIADGLNLFDYKDVENPEFITNLPGYCLNFASDKGGKIWFVTYEGIHIWDGLMWESYDKENSELPTNQINQIVISDDNVKWIHLGYPHHGLLKIENNEWTFFELNDIKVNNNPVTSIFMLEIGTANNLWITYSSKAGSNLLCFKNGNWETVYPVINGEQLPCYATSIYSDSNGNMWFIYSDSFTDYHNLSILKYNGNQWTAFQNPTNHNLLSIHVTESGKIWLGTTHGIEMLETDS